MKRKSRRPFDLRLKIAIIESRRTQRWLAVETRIGESRLSEIVGHRANPSTRREQERIVKFLGGERADYFSPAEIELADAAVETPGAAAEAAS